MILETDRLYLREMEQSDFDSLCKILKDPKAMYAYEHGFSDEEVQEWLDKQRKRYRDYGFGLWAVIEKSSNQMIGQCGLTMQDFNGMTVCGKFTKHYYGVDMPHLVYSVKRSI